MLIAIGTGKYKDYAENAAALDASGAEIITVAIRRVNLSDPDQPMLVDYIDPAKVTRSAVQNAASIAIMVLTTEAAITEIPKEEPVGPPAGMGGMPGMM